MPELSLKFWDHSVLHRVDAFEVESTMLFPHDEAKRQHYILTRVIDWYEAEQDTDTKTLLRDHVLWPTDDNGTLQRLLNHKDATRTQPKEIKKSYDQGCLAGQIAAYLMLMHESLSFHGRSQGPAHDSSLRKAMDIIEKVYHCKRKKSSEAQKSAEIPTRNRNYINEAWRSHKAVAHLWGTLALHHSQQNFAEEDLDLTFRIHIRGDPSAFLAKSEVTRQCLTKTKAWDNTSSWGAPAHIELPMEDVLFDHFPLDGNVTDELLLYKADPNRR